ncbi:MAG TPA: RimK/LysX family protein [Candidatus Saccharimonadales bacterium]|nr:RimK/LysX family protein [Candidatus Saccharimonadales bacterium]
MDDRKKLLGGSTYVDFPELGLAGVPTRIDTGARLSSLWALVEERPEGVLSVTFLGPENALYTGKKYEFTEYEQIVIASSMGHMQKRYKVKLLVKIKGKKIRAQFTLADRSTQVYPVLIGRNVLRGKFIVDVKKGHTLLEQEKKRTADLQTHLEDPKKENEL